MPRSSRSGGGRSAPAGSRGAHTMAAPQHAPAQQMHAPAAQQQRAPGLFGQMASTAAGVAVGSTVGHGISNMLFGGGGQAAAPAPDQYAQQAQQQQQPWAQSQDPRTAGNCELQSKDFLRCLESTGNDMQSCSYYLDQLKACQAAARPY
ncbi:hypothetical protein IE81DRAFT_365333 [Ceraceosorus guamensis]|uniref:CHCH domain-containing protein n=1 Tax=Ceraceosorus guamensis TaxID=1522189 RepID=A0A316W226_9BASI|nr:hypothetical protein IE81DRAFT_365333 [Ceraceosorus guamensis]PWN43916.1 hypothetical protein IE81DRAFT_365333 [Ceraceosorus guamensis]